MIIETIDQFSKFCNEHINGKKVFVHPVFCDHEKHYMNNRISCLYVHELEKKVSGMLCFNHSEALSLPKKILDNIKSASRIYCTNKKELLTLLEDNSDNLFDVSLLYYIHTNETIDFNFYTAAHTHFYRNFSENVNRIIPLYQHISRLDKISFEIEKILKNFETSSELFPYLFYNNKVIPVLYNIEKNGIPIDVRLFPGDEKHVYNDVTYGDYNIYTSTGRPSNSFSGVNYAALNKTDGTRKFVKSNKGILVLFDYSSFHIKLIAKEIGYEFPQDVDIHDYLGKQYGEHDQSKSKIRNFRYLYGGIPTDISDKVRFFREVDKYLNEIWSYSNKAGYIEIPLSKRKIHTEKITQVNRTKVFNYLIQALETEFMISVIEDIFFCLKDRSTKLVLYLYDGLLFDYDLSDGKEVMLDIYNIMIKNGFGVKITAGKNFHDMKNVTNYF